MMGQNIYCRLQTVIFLLVFCAPHLAFVFPAYSFFVEDSGAGTGGALKTIAIDPGHGGEDYGAIGPSGIKEKDINLEIAKRLEKIILQKMTVRVILTRTDDTFIPLEERAAIANKNNADLFISIHANASSRKGAAGIETYFLSFDASDDDAKRVAAFENKAMPEETALEKKGADDLKLILTDMAQTEFLNESSQLAEMLHEYLSRIIKRGDRGVKQAPFIVLAGAAMPAALVEVGFISNAKEEKRLSLSETQNAIASAIFKAIKKFDGILKNKMGFALE